MKTQLWQRLRAARERGPRGAKTQAEIAAACVAELGGKLSRVAVSLWESPDPKRRTKPNYEQIKVISDETGVDLAWLMEDGETLDPKPISSSDATQAQALPNQRRRVRIEGAAAMDEKGFWRRGEREAELWEVNTDDPEAYAVRLLTQHFDPVVQPGQCLLVSPAATIKIGRGVLVTLVDGRQSFRTYRGHDYGVWHFAEVNRPTSYLDLPDSDVERVERVMSVSWTD